MNKNQLMNTVKYYGKNLHGYIDLILIHDNNIINITETNCELKKPSSRREHEEDGGGIIEALVLKQHLLMVVMMMMIIMMMMIMMI